jgi:CheY-like chemotaxis protein
MRQRKDTLLIVEDDHNLAEMLGAYFSERGYAVLETAWGEQSIDLATGEQPDLVILDIRLPDIDGFEVCHRLRVGHTTRHIPVIFLTERRDRMDKLYGLELGVVDYITKPFDLEELQLRVRNTLDRAIAAKTEHPVTGLPESHTTDKQLVDLLESGCANWGVLLVTLRGLWAFRELYGFVASDDVLRVFTLSLSNAAMEINGADTFCGHLDDDTFVCILRVENIDRVYKRIVDRMGHSLEFFYPADNRGGKARTADRLGIAASYLRVSDGPFDSVDDLKARLLASRQDVRAS